MISFLLMIAAAVVSLTGCGTFDIGGDDLKVSYASDTRLFFDTQVSISIYDDNAEELLQGCFNICGDMEKTLSAQKKESELYRINHRDIQETEISDTLSECIKAGLFAGEISDGEFDITILPVSSLWDFRTGKGRVPDPSKIKAALKHVDQKKIALSGNRLSFDDKEARIDLGATAKGYISGRLKEYLKEAGCDGAVINLGGNVSTLGSKGGEKFKVGIQKPFDDRGEILATVSIGEGCMISSGTYERYFEQDGKIYHHILSAKTGYPAETGLTQVTVIGKDDTLCDTLSTVFMLTGRNKAEKIIEEEGYDIQVIFVDTDNNMTLFIPGDGERDISEGVSLSVK
ncbi:MAG: FAD:protein FMN transferase [Lachnospiraceae bacterium]|nr:FAD:protein FMN transferase [Lachnospiraceae bacterium]